jgi:hypothetical protein
MSDKDTDIADLSLSLSRNGSDMIGVVAARLGEAWIHSLCGPDRVSTTQHAVTACWKYRQKGRKKEGYKNKEK